MRALRRPSGLTLAELLISFVLVLLLLLYTISSFVASNNYIKRSKEYSTALFLSQTKMEELQVTPMSDIRAEEADFAPPFERYRYRLDLSPWEGELQQLEVIVTSPRGAIARIRTLRQSQAHQGVIADPATNTVAFTLPGSNQVQYWDDAAGALATPTQAMPSGHPGGLAGNPGYGYIWALNTDTNALRPYREGTPTNPWGLEVPFPAGGGLGPSRISGLTSDSYGNFVFAADWSNRGIWIFADGVPGLARGFVFGRPHAPVSPPLGIPSGLATDPAGSVLFVADTENQCLRKLFVNLADPSQRPEGYTSEELEAAAPPGRPRDSIGFWYTERLRHPKGMGAPQGVAVNSTGWVIYTIDRAYLYRLIENAPGDFDWERFPLDPGLTQASPSGLAFDEFNNLLFITTRSGELWKFQTVDQEFHRLYPAGGGGA